jgi:hypothetical protein
MNGSGTGKGYCYQHVRAITVAIDQHAEKALGNRGYFLNKPAASASPGKLAVCDDTHAGGLFRIPGGYWCTPMICQPK